MSTFDNVTIIRQANIYFDGGVTSRTIQFTNGETKTLGIILPGEYHFDTKKQEVMEIQSGEVEVLLPGNDQWQRFSAGQSFTVPANASFQIKASSITDYCCSFVE
jgi:uncharacterized protein YaiE (UPF0345 family)